MIWFDNKFLDFVAEIQYFSRISSFSIRPRLNLIYDRAVKVFFFNEMDLEYYLILAEGPGVARGIFFLKFLKKIFECFFSLCHPPASPECPQKISAQSVQPFGRL